MILQVSPSPCRWMALLSAVFFKLFLFIWLAEKCFLGFLAFLRCKKKTYATFMHVILSKKKNSQLEMIKKLIKEVKCFPESLNGFHVIIYPPLCHSKPVLLSLLRNTKDDISSQWKSLCSFENTWNILQKNIFCVLQKNEFFFSCRFVHEKVIV